MNDIKTYTVKEAESILKVKGKAIRGYIKDGKLKASKIGKAWVIKQEDIEKFINDNRQEVTKLGQQKTIAELNSKKLAAVLSGAAGAEAQWQVSHCVELSMKYKAKHPDYKPDNLEQIIKDYLAGLYDLIIFDQQKKLYVRKYTLSDVKIQPYNISFQGYNMQIINNIFIIHTINIKFFMI